MRTRKKLRAPLKGRFQKYKNRMVKAAITLKKEQKNAAEARDGGHSPIPSQEVDDVLHGASEPEHSDAGRVDALPVVRDGSNEAVGDAPRPRDISELSVEEKIKLWRS